MTDYLDFLNPDNKERNTCLNCGVPTPYVYCNTHCKREYNA